MAKKIIDVKTFMKNIINDTKSKDNMNVNMVDSSTIFSNFLEPTYSSINSILKSSRTDDEMYNDIIKNNAFIFILNDIYNNKGDSKFIEFFIDIKFLSLLEKFINNNVYSISSNILLTKAIFNISFEYIVYENTEFSNDIVLSIYKNICKSIILANNNRLLYSLMMYMKNEDYSLYLIIARESLLEISYIDRIFYVLMKSDIRYIDNENLKNIFSLLHCNIDDLFIRNMFNVLDENEYNNISKNSMLIDSEITNTILDLLQHQPMDYIVNTLCKYTNMYCHGGYSRIKFHMNTISTGDYDRIYYAMNILNSNNIFVP